MDPFNWSILYITLLVIRIVIIVYCVNNAKDLNRNRFGWGIFAFCLPLIAFIWIQCLDPIYQYELSGVNVKKTGTNTSSSNQAVEKIDPLITLNELKEKGIITDEQYEEKLKNLIDIALQQKLADELKDWNQLINNRINKMSQSELEILLKAKGLFTEQEYEVKVKEILTKYSDKVLKQVSNIDKVVYHSLSKPKKDKVEAKLDKVLDSEIIVEFRNKIIVIDELRLQDIIKNVGQEYIQIIYQNKIM